MKKLIMFLLLASGVVLANSQDFTAIDTHVKNIPRNADNSIESLAEYLNKKANNDLEKVRAYYVWLTDNIAYDTKTFFSNKPNPKVTAEETLKRKQSVCQGYSELFKALCQQSGIDAYVVSGYSKGYGYNPNRKLTKSDHAWNAVKVDGKWQLLDATWGAGFVDDSRKYNKRFQEKYFLTDPKVFILDHLPTDPMWQLLPCPITIEDYKKPKEEITELVNNLKPCFSFSDSIQAYQTLTPVEQQVKAAERAYRFNPNNHEVPGFAYLQLAFEMSQIIPTLYDAEKYREALELNREVLGYNQKAYGFLRKSKSDQGKNAAAIAKNNISTMKKNIKSLEDFLE